MWKFDILAPGSFRVPARMVTRVFLHITDSDAPNLVGVGLAAEVDRWHKTPPPMGNGWQGIGYHLVVDKAGAVSSGRPLELTPAAQLGPDGMGNVGAIAISTHASKLFTVDELLATRELCREIDAAYKAAGHPVTFWGHTEIDPRPCPVYDWRSLCGLDASRRFGVMPFGDVAAIAAAASGGAKPKLPIVDQAETHLLVQGCHSAEVGELQAKLGMDGADVDDWFGPKTLKAVQYFQTAHGLTPSGVVDQVTRAALGL
jgi:hypothetical protein